MPLSLDNEIIVAEALARMGHRNQLDKQNRPYIGHVEHVALAVPAAAKPIAWGHDLLEDTTLTEDDLRAAGLSEDTIDGIKLVTRTKTSGNTYAKDIDTLCAAPKNYLALLVKEQDLIDHLTPECPVSLRPRYEAALPKVRAAIRKQLELVP